MRVPRCGSERCDFLEHTAYVLRCPSCGSRIHLQTWTPQLYIWKEQLHQALSLSQCILSWRRFVKFVSLLVLRSTHVDSGCLLDLGVLVSGCKPFYPEPRHACFVCGSLSFLGILPVWDLHQWWGCAGRNDLGEPYTWLMDLVPRPVLARVMLSTYLVFLVGSLARYIGLKHTLIQQ